MTRSLMTTFLVFSVLIFAGAAQSGEIDDLLLEQIEGRSAEATVRVWLVLEGDHDASEFKRSVVARASTRAERHRLAYRELRDMSSRQQPLLNELARLKSERRVVRYKGYWIANVVEAEVEIGVLDQLAGHPDVAVIQPVPVIRLLPAVVPAETDLVPSDATSHEDNLDHIKAPQAWAAGYTGAGRLLCSFDTGVEGSHPALNGAWKGNDGDSAAAWFDQKDTLVYPHPVINSSHGTHTTGIAVGRTAGDTIGVAPGAKWIAAGVIGLQETSILDAFEWAANPDGDPNTIADVPDVINHSWFIDPFPSCANAVYDAIEHTEALGIVNIISAGNSGAGPQTIKNPADRANDILDCFAVGNIDHDADLINSTSSRGPSPCNVTRIKPQVVAPGTQIRSAWNTGGYNVMTGTSQAAPHVSGLVLLLRQKNPNATVDEIKSAILNNTQVIGPGGLPNNDYGYGEIDCMAALAALSAESSPAVRLYDFDHAVVMAGDTVTGSVVLKNLGADAVNVTASLTGSNAALTVLDGALTFGSIGRGDTVRSVQSLRIIVADTVTDGSLLPIEMTVSGTGFSTPLQLYVRVADRLQRSIVTHDEGAIEFSISNYGALGLGSNALFGLGGAGFKFNGGSNYLWEGGVILGTGTSAISDAVHGIYDEPSRDFTVAPGGNFQFMVPGPAAAQQSYCVFNDSRADNPHDLEIEQETFALEAPNDDHLIIRYIITNTGGSTVSNLRFGLFLDWDVVSYSSNAGGFEASDGFAWISNSSHTIHRGVKLIDGDLATAGSFAAWDYDCCQGDGFAEYEKYSVLASGFTNANRYADSSTSLFQIMAAGPMTLAPGGKDTVSFALLAGNSFAEIQAAANKAMSVPQSADDPETPATLPDDFTLYQNYPNPFNPGTVIAFDLPRRGEYTVDIYNALGQRVDRLSGEAAAGRVTVDWNGARFASGVYLYRVTVGEYARTRKMLLLK